MLQKPITKLTPEQEALIPSIRDQWIRIGLDTTPLNKRKAEDAIALAYKCARLKPPEQILWFNNPLDAILYVNSAQEQDMAGEVVREAISENIWKPVWYSVRDAVEEDVVKAIGKAVREPVWKSVWTDVWVHVEDTVGEAIWKACVNSFRNFRWLAFYAYFDAIGVDCSKLKGLWSTGKHCGWWWAFENLAVVTPKPSIIALNEQGRLHEEGRPAFAYEEFNIYAYHGVRLPEKYGKLYPTQWQAQWLVSEENAELRRVLIQGIGYERICQELQAIELDSWQEYTLIQIDPDVDLEPIYLLKMTCPSTGYIYALRVPPDKNSASEAISWVNWGVDPEEFSVQT